MVGRYIPKQKDIILLDFNPIKGHEQGGFRPAVVISTTTFNKFTKMSIVCPITSNIKNFPTHYLLKYAKKIEGSVLCEHIRSINFEDRNIKFVESLSDKDFNEIICLLDACLVEE